MKCMGRSLFSLLKKLINFAVDCCLMATALNMILTSIRNSILFIELYPLGKFGPELTAFVRIDHIGIEFRMLFED
jgi:hypothetical protein